MEPLLISSGQKPVQQRTKIFKKGVKTRLVETIIFGISKEDTTCIQAISQVANAYRITTMRQVLLEEQGTQCKQS
jgi:hypothetical protein